MLDTWLIHNQIRIKKSTYYKYQTLIEKHIKPELGNTKLSDINSELLNNYIHQKLQNGRLHSGGELSPSYVKTITIILNSVVKFGIKENKIHQHTITIIKPTITKNELHILNRIEQITLEEYLLTNDSLTHLGLCFHYMQD